jgi:hypothetical protein
MEAVHKKRTTWRKNRVKGRTLADFALKKPPQSADTHSVLRVLLNFCRRPTIRFGLRRDPRGRFRDPRFASFMADSNRSRPDTDRHDAALKGRKLVKNVFKLALFGGGAWIVLESAKALSVF